MLFPMMRPFLDSPLPNPDDSTTLGEKQVSHLAPRVPARACLCLRPLQRQLSGNIRRLPAAFRRLSGDSPATSGGCQNRNVDLMGVSLERGRSKLRYPRFTGEGPQNPGGRFRGTPHGRFPRSTRETASVMRVRCHPLFVVCCFQTLLYYRFFTVACAVNACRSLLSHETLISW